MVGALVLGLALVIAFVLWEQRTKAPMLPMWFFRQRAFATANPTNVLVFASLYGTMFFLAQYFQIVLGEGPLVAGLMLMPWTATLMVCAPIAGRLADKRGERTRSLSSACSSRSACRSGGRRRRSASQHRPEVIGRSSRLSHHVTTGR